jgi:hypothetical protein
MYNNVLKQLGLPPDTKPESALTMIKEKVAQLRADPAQSVWEVLKAFKKETIIRAYCA